MISCNYHHGIVLREEQQDIVVQVHSTDYGNPEPFPVLEVAPAPIVNGIGQREQTNAQISNLELTIFGTNFDQLDRTSLQITYAGGSKHFTGDCAVETISTDQLRCLLDFRTKPGSYTVQLIVNGSHHLGGLVVRFVYDGTAAIVTNITMVTGGTENSAQMRLDVVGVNLKPHMMAVLLGDDGYGFECLPDMASTAPPSSTQFQCIISPFAFGIRTVQVFTVEGEVYTHCPMTSSVSVTLPQGTLPAAPATVVGTDVVAAIAGTPISITALPSNPSTTNYVMTLAVGKNCAAPYAPVRPPWSINGGTASSLNVTFTDSVDIVTVCGATGATSNTQFFFPLASFAVASLEKVQFKLCNDELSPPYVDAVDNFAALVDAPPANTVGTKSSCIRLRWGHMPTLASVTLAISSSGYEGCARPSATLTPASTVKAGSTLYANLNQVYFNGDVALCYKMFQDAKMTNWIPLTRIHSIACRLGNTEDCSNHGSCVGQGATVRCQCRNNFFGPTCGETCPMSTRGVPCGTTGQCRSDGTCHCPSADDVGPACDQAVTALSLQSGSITSTINHAIIFAHRDTAATLNRWSLFRVNQAPGSTTRTTTVDVFIYLPESDMMYVDLALWLDSSLVGDFRRANIVQYASKTINNQKYVVGTFDFSPAVQSHYIGVYVTPTEIWTNTSAARSILFSIAVVERLADSMQPTSPRYGDLTGQRDQGQIDLNNANDIIAHCSTYCRLTYLLITTLSAFVVVAVYVVVRSFCSGSL